MAGVTVIDNTFSEINKPLLTQSVPRIQPPRPQPLQIQREKQLDNEIDPPRQVQWAIQPNLEPHHLKDQPEVNCTVDLHFKFSDSLVYTYLVEEDPIMESMGKIEKSIYTCLHYFLF